MFGQEAWHLCQPLLLLLTTAVLNQNTSSASEDQTHTIQSSKPEDQIDETQQYSVWRSNSCYTPALLLEIRSTAPNTVRCLESKCMAPTSSVPGFQNDTTHKPWTWKANSHHPTEQCLDIQFTPPTSSGSWCPLAMCSLSLGWFIFWECDLCWRRK